MMRPLLLLSKRHSDANFLQKEEGEAQRREKGRQEEGRKRKGVALSRKCRCIDVSPGYIYGSTSWKWRKLS